MEKYDLIPIKEITEARELGANALIGLDIETSDIGQSYVTLVSATGTTVKVEPEG